MLLVWLFLYSRIFLFLNRIFTHNKYYKVVALFLGFHLFLFIALLNASLK